MDPIYELVLAELRGRSEAIVDVGCGVGILPLFLRESGVSAPLTGIDVDERKIDIARKAARTLANIDFIAGSAGAELPPGRNVAILDVLHYCSEDVQRAILREAAIAVPRGGVVIIRSGVRDGSWRYRLTWLTDLVGKAIRWNRGERLSYPTAEMIGAAFEGFEIDVRPAWGRTLFNNYLFVFRK
jgi:2-polyprenyl-3-methyl-5-hydroxy-6-metoxy-1,4-benzoquinol methylase